MQENQSIQLVTTTATAAHVWLDRPDIGHRHSDGRYKVSLVMEPDDPGFIELRDSCIQLAQVAWPSENGELPEWVNMPYQDGNQRINPKTGEVIDRFKGRFLVTARTQYQPVIVDEERNELKAGVHVRAGDLIRLSVTCQAYGLDRKPSGIALRLRGVQLMQRRPFQPANAEDLFPSHPKQTSFPIPMSRVPQPIPTENWHEQV
ncbi:MAG: DUF2815 family protein [Magnetococcales bacterium]|nr:DUF2815 family protein [Magnetococcales bacterium]